MPYGEDMREIIVSIVGDRLHFFIQVDPETRTQDVLFAREDLAWTDRKAAGVGEFREYMVDNGIDFTALAVPE